MNYTLLPFSLSETPLSSPEEEWYTDGSVFVGKRERKARYAIMSLEETRWSLPPGTSAQKADKSSGTRKEKRTNVYTDFKYAFHPEHPCSHLKEKRDVQCQKLSY